MSKLWKILLSSGLSLIVVAGLLGLVFVVPVLTTEIDPNLMRPQCPGGKEWDQPGSSCHEGMIFDYFPRGAPVKRSEIAAKKKRGR